MSELASELSAHGSSGRPAPVLIAGGGPVGLTAALLLARHEVPSVVLEAQSRRQAIGSRSICVQRDVLDVLERAGVGAQVAASGVTWYRGRTYYRDKQVLEITFPEVGDSAFPPFVNTPQTVVELLLEQRIADEPLVRLHYGHRVSAIQQDDTGVTLHASTSDGQRSFRGTHCVAADGPHSSIRELLGLPFPGMSYPDKFLIADIRVPAQAMPRLPERRFFFDPPWNPGRQVLLHPQPDGVWRIDWQVPEDFELDDERGGAAVHDRILAVVGEVDYEVVWLSVYRFHQRCVPAMQVGRVLLAGDAAHVMSPFGARGLNSGICDADNAAWKIALHRRGIAGPGLLRSYDIERRAAAEENLRITSETMRFLVPQNDAERRHRLDVLRRSVSDPAARAELNSGKLAEPYFYLDSPLTTPAAAEDVATFPREPGVVRPPVPGVLCPDGRLDWGMRLRELVGPRFVLLTNGCAWRAANRLEASLVGQPVPLDQADPAGVLTAALRLPARSAALVRPDGHLAAVLTEPAGGTAGIAAAVSAALRRATGWGS